jgi:hypothetical protein
MYGGYQTPQVPYYMPTGLAGNTVYGTYRQPLGPYAPMSNSGFGRPGGLVVGTLAAPGLAYQTGIATATQVIPTNARDMWVFDNATVLSGDRPAMHSSSYGPVGDDGSGHAAYTGMQAENLSYGSYGSWDMQNIAH